LKDRKRIKFNLRKALILVFSFIFVIGLSTMAYHEYEEKKADEAMNEALLLIGGDLGNLDFQGNMTGSGDENGGDIDGNKADGDAIDGENPADGTLADELYVPTEEELYYMEALKRADIEALKTANEDVIAWISIPDTKISYPVLQGDDNDYYLNHTWNKKRNGAGSIFMEYRNNPDFSDFNTIIYGHRMEGESMFHGLHYYEEQEYYEAHKDVYIRTSEGVFCYKIFAAYEGSVTGDSFRLGFSEIETRLDFIEYCKDNSFIESDIEVDENSQIITLSTCMERGHDTRFVVHAVLKEGE